MMTAAELSVAVAEQVMGWRYYRCIYVGKTHDVTSDAPTSMIMFMSPEDAMHTRDGGDWRIDPIPKPRDHSEVRNYGVPGYAESMTEAWLAWNRLLERGFELRLVNKPNRPAYAYAYHPKLKVECATEAAAASRAICQTALRAVDACPESVAAMPSNGR
jgi:hypothetical protein